MALQFKLNDSTEAQPRKVLPRPRGLALLEPAGGPGSQDPRPQRNSCPRRPWGATKATRGSAPAATTGWRWRQPLGR
eukprot:77551-Pyramimonas_sp.AAC.1